MKIALEGVSKRFGPVAAVDAVSLEIAEDECFFLLGPSGCGKTTILRIIAGFCDPDSGHILFNETRVNDLPPHQRHTGMVFQNYALWPHLTVAGNVEFGLTVPGRTLPEKERKDRVMRILKAVHMDSFSERKPNQLSGGQQQRVALARALVIEPACLLLDEPLSNLDAKLRLEMRLEIRRLVKHIGITTIYVTHDQQEALSMADRCAILRDGRVEQVGTPRELYEHPANRFVADFIGGTNLIWGIIRSVAGEEARIETRMGTWTGHTPTSSFQPGQSVVLSVRHEAFHFTAPPAHMPNLFSGKITDTMYYGDRTEYWLAMPDGTEIKALERGSSSAQPSSGEVRFWAEPTDVVILPDH